MKFTFTEKKIEVSPEVRAYAEKKIGKLDKFFRNESDTAVTFSSERGRYRAEVTLCNNGIYYRVSDLTLIHARSRVDCDAVVDDGRPTASEMLLQIMVKFKETHGLD